jgi:hypothetical protein
METEFKAIHSAKTTLAEAEEGENEVKPVFYREEECILRRAVLEMVWAQNLVAVASKVSLRKPP